MSRRTAEIRRTLVVLLMAIAALFSFLPFLARLLGSLVAGRSARRKIRAWIADRGEVPTDAPPAAGAVGGRIYLLAGEDSGDLHAANLVKEIRRADPASRVEGMGGPRMEAAGCRLDVDLVRMNVMGVLPVVRAVGRFFGLFRDLLRRLEEDPPDVLVPVDYPGFNLRAARLAKRRGIPVVAYISPQVWAWAPWRVRSVARSVDRILVILPFERELFRDRGLPAAFVGHPLFEHLDGEAFRNDAPPRETIRVGLLPGSRSREVEALLPWMLDAARRIRADHPEVDLVLPYQRSALRPTIDRILSRFGDLPVRLVEGRTHEVMATLDAALVASGTATLELAYYGVPMVIHYRIGPISALFRRAVLIVRDIGLVNIVAGRRIVPEHVGWRSPAASAAARVVGWIEDPAARDRVRADLSEVRQRLSSRGVSARAAGFVLAAVSPPRERSDGPPASPGSR